MVTDGKGRPQYCYDSHVSWESRLREMLLVGGSLAAAACAHNVETPADAGGDSDAGIPPSFCCNANPDPCCRMLCDGEGPDSSTYAACEAARSACQAHWGSYGTLEDGGIGCDAFTVPSNFTFNPQGEPSCGSTACNLGPSYKTCCISSTGAGDCVDSGTACPPGGSVYECLDAFECPSGLSCCGIVDETTATVAAACQSTLTSPLSPCSNVAAADAATLVSVQLCQQEQGCQYGESCIWQDCTVEGQPIELTMCGIHSGPPLNCTAHSLGDGGPDSGIGTGSSAADDAAVNLGDTVPNDAGAFTPAGITVDPNGYVIVIELPRSANSPSANASVNVYGPPALSYEPDEALVQSMTGLVAASDGGAPIWSPNVPVALAVDGQGHLLLANSHETIDATGCSFAPPGAYGSDILVFEDNGTSVNQPSLSFQGIFAGNVAAAGTDPDCISGVAASPANGDIFVTTADGVEVLNIAGQVVASAGYPMGASGNAIAIGPSGSAYVTDGNNGAVYEYQLSGASLALASTFQVNGGSSQPGSVAVDGSGNVYVADWQAQTVDIYSASGSSMGQIMVGCQAWLALDSAGQLYVSCSTKGINVYRNESGWMVVAHINLASF